MDVSGVWEHLDNVWVLAGLVFVLFSGLLKLLAAKISNGAAVERLILNGMRYLFVLGLVSIVLGFVQNNVDDKINGIQTSAQEKLRKVSNEGGSTDREREVDVNSKPIGHRNADQADSIPTNNSTEQEVVTQDPYPVDNSFEEHICINKTNNAGYCVSNDSKYIWLKEGVVIKKYFRLPNKFKGMNIGKVTAVVKPSNATTQHVADAINSDSEVAIINGEVLLESGYTGTGFNGKVIFKVYPSE